MASTHGSSLEGPSPRGTTLRYRSHTPILCRLAFRALLATVVLAASSGCGDDGSSSETTTLGPPSLSIETPLNGACVAIDSDAGLSVPVQVVMQNWYLRPEGFCGDVYSQCGFLVFLVDGQEAVRSAALMTDVPVGSLGEHQIRVQLRGDDDLVALDAEGQELVADVRVTVAESCPAK